MAFLCHHMPRVLGTTGPSTEESLFNFSGDDSVKDKPTTRRKAHIVILTAVLLPVLALMGLFAVDVGYFALLRSRAQIGVDAGALAAVEELPGDQASLDSAASWYVSLNVHADSNSQVTAEAGIWDEDTATFVLTNLTDATAVRVTANRTQNGLLFGGILPTSPATISATAIAAKMPDIFDWGIIAGNTVTLGQGVQQRNYGVYGRNGVEFGRDASVTDGGKVGTLDESTVTYGTGALGLPESIVETDREPTLANNVMQIIDDLAGGVNLPPQITYVEYFPNATQLPDNLLSATAYVFDRSIVIEKDYSVSDAIIATRGSIEFGQNGSLRNTGVATAGDATIGLYAGGIIEISQGAAIEGVTIVGGIDVDISQGLQAFDANVQAAGNVILAQDPCFNTDWSPPKSAFFAHPPVLVN